MEHIFVADETLLSFGGLWMYGQHTNWYHDNITYIVLTEFIRPHPRNANRDLKRQKNNFCIKLFGPIGYFDEFSMQTNSVSPRALQFSILPCTVGFYQIFHYLSKWNIEFFFVLHKNTMRMCNIRKCKWDVFRYAYWLCVLIHRHRLLFQVSVE